MNEPAIRTVKLTKHYESGAVTALAGVSMQIAQGEFVCIVGPSGSGKSTLLNMLGALDLPTSGEVFLKGRALSKLTDLDHVRACEVGFVFQLHNLIPNLTAIENVEVPMFAIGVPHKERRRRAAELLAALELRDRQDSIAVNLSGGERQRVAIARALANRPTILLADEPTGDVDSKMGQQIMKYLLEARSRSQITLVVVTHNSALAKCADRTLSIIDGRLQ